MKRIELVYIAAIIVLVFFLAKCGGGGEVIERTTVDTVTVVQMDTFLIEKEVPIEIEKKVSTTQVRVDTIYIDSAAIALNVYRDTVQFDSMYFAWYLARVEGILHDMKIGIYDNRPDSVVTQTITNTITKTNYISPKGLYIGGALSTTAEINLGGAYLWKKNLISVGYDFQNQGVRVGYMYKIK